MDNAPLSICLFGSSLIRRNGRPHPLGIRGSTLQLLRYLTVNAGREVRRECIADQFWRNSSCCRQRSSLNSAIWRIGKKLPDDDRMVLYITAATICLEIDDDVPIDTRILCSVVHTASAPDAMSDCLADQLARALDASEAPFLDGLVDDWALAERERVTNLRLRGLTLLMHWYGDQRRYEDALEIGRRLLAEDPFRETAQIDIMWLYVLNRQWAQAIKQYQSYAELLHRELDIEPMVETRALYDHIRCDLNCGVLSASKAVPFATDRIVNDEKLDAMLTNIEKSRRQFYHTLRAQLT